MTQCMLQSQLDILADHIEHGTDFLQAVVCQVALMDPARRAYYGPAAEAARLAVLHLAALAAADRGGGEKNLRLPLQWRQATLL